MKLPRNCVALLAALISLGAGASAGASPSAEARSSGTTKPAADYPVVTGDPFTINGVTYTPADKPTYDAVGYASVGSESDKTISAAHKTLPLPSYAEVTALDTGRTILVRVDRRGPMANDRLVELSPAAAAQIGITGDAKTPVRLRRVNPPEAERALLRNGRPAPERMATPKSLLGVLTRLLDAQEPLTPLPAPSGTAQAAPQAPAKEPATTPAPTAPGKGGFEVQAATFSTQERADKAARALGGQIKPAGKYWRMVLGPYARRDEAAAALAKARSAGYSDARIQRTD